MRSIHDLGTSNDGRQRHSCCQRLGGRDHVRHHARVLDGPQLPGSTHPGLDLVGDQHDAVQIGELSQTLQPGRRCGNETGLSLHRFHHDRRDVGRIHDGCEAVIEIGDVPIHEVLLGQLRRPSIDVGERKPIDLGGKRAEALLEEPELGRHRHGQIRPPVIRPVEHDDALSTREGAGDVDGGLHCLGARVHEHGLLCEVSRGALVEPLTELHHRLERRHDCAHVDQLLCLSLHGRHHRLGGVADGEHSDSSGQVDQAIPVDVGDDGTMGRLDRNRCELGRPRRRCGLTPGDQLTALWTGDLGDETDGGSGGGDHGCMLSGRLHPRSETRPGRRPWLACTVNTSHRRVPEARA